MEHIKGPDFPTAGIIMGRSGIRAAYDDARRGEVRSLDVLHQARQVDVRVLDVSNTAVDHVAQVVGRDVDVYKRQWRRNVA